MIITITWESDSGLPSVYDIDTKNSTSQIIRDLKKEDEDICDVDAFVTEIDNNDSLEMSFSVLDIMDFNDLEDFINAVKKGNYLLYDNSADMYEKLITTYIPSSEDEFANEMLINSYSVNNLEKLADHITDTIDRSFVLGVDDSDNCLAWWE